MKTKVALITGSTSGIGMGIAEKFASEGYNIIFNGLEKNGPDIADEVAKKHSIKTFYSPANMLRADEITAMITEGEKKLGDINVLVNNAGIQYVAPLEEFPDEKWNMII